jgi:uncharacterized membrane protein YfcA
MIETSLSPWQFVLLVAAIGFLIGLSKGGLGGGLGAVVTPLFSLAVHDVAQAVVLLLPLLMVGDVFALSTYWRQWDGALVRRLLPGALVGIAVGLVVLVNLPANVMRVAMAAFTLALVGYRVAGDFIRRLRYQPRAWHAWAVGGLAGVASTLFNAGGPPFSAYLILNAVPPRPFIATGAIFFALLNLTKLPAFTLAGLFKPALLASIWWGFLLIPVGNFAGRWLVERMGARAFERAVILLLLLASGLLLWQSL